jgi:hypothetical protein
MEWASSRPWYWPTDVGTWGSAARSWLFSYSQVHFYTPAVKHLKVPERMSMQATCNAFRKTEILYID